MVLIRKLHSFEQFTVFRSHTFKRYTFVIKMKKTHFMERPIWALNVFLTITKLNRNHDFIPEPETQSAHSALSNYSTPVPARNDFQTYCAVLYFSRTLINGHIFISRLYN